MSRRTTGSNLLGHFKLKQRLFCQRSCLLHMMFGILFALLALFLAGFREGVWTKYTAQDVARWQAEAAAQAVVAVATGLPQPPAAPPVVSSPAYIRIAQPYSPLKAERKEVAEMELEAV
jgi:hypothetical protein